MCTKRRAAAPFAAVHSHTMTAPATFLIRPTTAADVATILGFVRELAAYEKLAHEAVATEDMIARGSCSARVPTPRP